MVENKKISFKKNLKAFKRLSMKYEIVTNVEDVKYLQEVWFETYNLVFIFY